MIALSPSQPNRPFRGLSSLWNVLRFYADKFVAIADYITQMEIGYLNPVPEGAANLPAPSLLAPEGLSRLTERVERARVLSAEIGLPATVDVFDRLLKWIAEDTTPRVANYADGIANLLGEARVQLRRELEMHLFYQISENKKQFFDAPSEAFGQAVAWAFPTAAPDIGEAVTCYATDHPTASVFHCMRVLECGLRVLATDVGKTFDRQQWHNIIEEIESGITAIRKTGPKSAERDERLQWLSEAAKEFMYFKDGWRNYVSHARGRYDEHQARSVMEHVLAFMNHLATRLSE